MSKTEKPQLRLQIVRISNVNLDGKKRSCIALQSIYGVGATRATQICLACKIDENTKIGNLTDLEIEAIRVYIAQGVAKGDYILEDDLRKLIVNNIKDLRKLGCYRGSRHARGLPVRGQRTKTNARTRKGKKSNPIAKKKIVKK